MASWDLNAWAPNLCIQNSTNNRLTTAGLMRPPSAHKADTSQMQTLTLQKNLY